MKCPRCDGKGSTIVKDIGNYGEVLKEWSKTCYYCKGTGRVCPENCAGISKEQAREWYNLLKMWSNFDNVDELSKVRNEMRAAIEGRVE